MAGGLHEVVTTYHPCGQCGQVRSPSEERTTRETNFDVYEWTFSAATTNALAEGEAVSATLYDVPKGNQRIEAVCSARCSTCGQCTDGVSMTEVVTVHELTVACDPWIGIERRKDSTAIPTNTATAKLDPLLDGAICKWDKRSKASEFKDQTDKWKYHLFVPDKKTASASYQAEVVEATVSGVMASNNFTIVKVDVTIGNCAEDKEETEGRSFPARTAWRT